MNAFWGVYNSIYRLTSNFSIDDWLNTVACLTLLMSVYLIAAGSRR